MGTMKTRTRLLRRVRSRQVAQDGVSLHRLLREVPSRRVAQEGVPLHRLLRKVPSRPVAESWLAISEEMVGEEEGGFSCG